MHLPAIAPYPPASLQKRLATSDWEASLDAWISLTTLHLRTADAQFRLTSIKDGSLHRFLVSYMAEAYLTLMGQDQNDHKARTLRRNVFLLGHRILSQTRPVPPSLLHWTFLGHLSHVYQGNLALRPLLSSIWNENRAAIDSQLLETGSELLQALLSPQAVSNSRLDELLHGLMLFFKPCPQAAEHFLAGSEMVDAISTCYGEWPDDTRRRALKFTYCGLMSLLDGVQPRISVVLDHLYSLKNASDSGDKSEKERGVLIMDLVSCTPLLSKLEALAQGPSAGRVRSIFSSLQKLKVSSLQSQGGMAGDDHRTRKRMGKLPIHTRDRSFSNEMHIHRMNLVSQIQDLFPDLGTGFVVRLLDEYNDDVETATANLLDDALPPRLRAADQQEELKTMHQPSGTSSHLAPRPTPLPERTRRNIFDDDALDKLEVDESRLHMGRKDPSQTADTLLDDRSAAPNKAAILSALAAFDSDEDERDDTYDVADVGGTLDTTPAGAAEDTREASEMPHEETLFNVYKNNPEVYARDSATRRSEARAALRLDTQMTDEAIEGWGLMLSRDSRSLGRLETKYSGFGGTHRRLESTAWRARDDVDGTGSSSSSRGGRRGGYRGRGRGGGGDGRGQQGNPSGLANDGHSHSARAHKEVHKSSRANHNRRDQRARKVARGMAG